MPSERDVATATRIALAYRAHRYGVEAAVAWIGTPVPPAKLQEALDWMGASREAGLEIVEAEEGR